MTDDGQHLLKPQRVSLSQQALQYLRSLIEAGVYQPGDQLPSQMELAAQLGISRPTLREALLGLEQEGAILLRHGVGTFISPTYDTRLQSGLERLESIFELASRQRFIPAYGKLETSQEPAGAELAKALHVEPNAIVTRVGRIILLEDRPVAYLEDVIPGQILSPNDLQGTFEGSVLDLLREDLRVRVGQAVANIVAVNADQRLVDRLGVKPRQALLLLDEILYDVEGSPIGVSYNYFVPEYFRFHVIRR